MRIFSGHVSYDANMIHLSDSMRETDMKHNLFSSYFCCLNCYMFITPYDVFYALKISTRKTLQE